MKDILPGFVRVSEVLGQWDKYGAITPEMRTKALERGSYIHDQIHLWSQGLHTSSDPLLASFQKWMAHSDAMIMESEKRYYDDKLMLTGCIDAIMDMGNKDFTIVDYKTSQSEDKKLWPLQGCFYYLLAKPKIPNLSKKVVFLKLDRDGDLPTAYVYEITDRLVNVCMSALNCFKYLNG